MPAAVHYIPGLLELPVLSFFLLLPSRKKDAKFRAGHVHNVLCHRASKTLHFTRQPRVSHYSLALPEAQAAGWDGSEGRPILRRIGVTISIAKSGRISKKSQLPIRIKVDQGDSRAIRFAAAANLARFVSFWR